MEDVKAAKWNFAPNLNASASQNYNFGSSIGVSVARIPADFRSNNFGINSTVNLFNGFANIQILKQSKIGVEIQVAAIAKMKNDISLNVVNAYLQILFAKEQLKVAQSQVSVTSINGLIQDVIKQRNVDLPVVQYTGQDSVDMQIDSETFFSVLNHLVQNAQEATQDDGSVEVCLSKSEGNVIIEIIDNGTGMTEDFISRRLFKPFDTTKGNAGMGIGVYEAKQFIEGIAGVIEVDSIVGKGSKFVITLPLNPIFEPNR